jgi:hypothetical protein
MPRKTRDIVFRVVGMKIVEKQKWVQQRNFPGAKRASKLDACTFKGCLAT